ncbi:hypothetical protein RvY_17562 [Ramazzottius varieornatus]|uniref:Rab-GAP TBC domain-containing protein n=1 Tax=Ramazzottius varieornatus TaxID=947166 RepID=A0A1D1W3B7_RAMVA|nr:hypothetical protein RvY_17562 [Ramazzottius varieornatus]
MLVYVTGEDGLSFSLQPTMSNIQSNAQERRDIVARYDRGRDENATIDPWEDPAFEVYHKRDRYGFIHDQRIPSSTKNDSKMVETELKRVHKWLQMLQNWDNVVGTEKFRRRIYKGIPNKVRSEVWRRLLKIEEIKREQEGVYKKMRDLAREQSPEIRQIDLDVNRTYRNHEMFRERYGIKQQALFHVLAAYSMYNTEVGYCQGMSQVAALLLMYMSDEDAFWAMSALLSDKKYAMHGFFLPGFPKLMRFQTQHEAILKKYLPKVKKHMDKHDVHTNLYSVKWFFQCFLDRVPFHLCLRLWDVYLYEGERLLIAMAFNVFRMHEKAVLKLKSMEGVVDLLQRNLELDFGYPDDEVVKRLGECMDELRRSKLDLPTSADNELPTKPFGLLYNPTVKQMRDFVDTRPLSAVANGRTSQSSSDGKSFEGLNGSLSSPPSSAEKDTKKETGRISPLRPSSRQQSSSSPTKVSVYENVQQQEGAYGRGNRVRPVEQPPSSSSSAAPPLEHNIGDHRYVSIVQVTTEKPPLLSSEGRKGGRLAFGPDTVVEKSEMYTREFTTSPLRSPTVFPRLTAAQIQSQKQGLKMQSDVFRYGTSNGDMEMKLASRLDGVMTSNHGGATVIRIGTE